MAYSLATTDPTKSTLQHVDLITTHTCWDTHPTTSTIRHVVTDIVKIDIDLEIRMIAYSSGIQFTLSIADISLSVSPVHPHKHNPQLLHIGRSVGSLRLSIEDIIYVVGMCAWWQGNGDGDGQGIAIHRAIAEGGEGWNIRCKNFFLLDNSQSLRYVKLWH